MFCEPLYPPQHRNKCYCHTKRENSIQYLQKHQSKKNCNYFVKTNGLAIINDNQSMKYNKKRENFVKVKSVPCANDSIHDIFTNRRYNYENNNCKIIDASATKKSLIPLEQQHNNNVTNSPAAAVLFNENVDRFRRLYDVAKFRFNNSNECISSVNCSNTSLNCYCWQNHVCKYRLMLNDRNQPVSADNNDNLFACYICGKLSIDKHIFTNNQLISTENCVILNKTKNGEQFEFNGKFNQQQLLVLEIGKPKDNTNNRNKVDFRTSSRKNLKNNIMYHSSLSLKKFMN